MSKINNISSVAKYESILLRRSWFYRIFLVLAVLVLCIFNLAGLVINENTDMWMMRALPSNIPYINLLLLNAGQAVIAVFLSSEFLKSDKKLDTSEVFYVHPLSNAEYVSGKIWGNLNVFIRLNLIIILIVIVFNLTSGLTVDWLAYITYFLIISIPTLIYIFGLSIALMLLLKNQAITFVLLLGYIALTLLYIEDKFYYLFDYMAFNLPLVKSSIVGFTNWSTVINHRFIYLLTGLGFICISIFLFRRLPNTKYGRYRWLALSSCFFLAGFGAGYKHVHTILYSMNIRAKYTEINNRYVHVPQMVIDMYDIHVEQHPETISATVMMHGTAQDSSSVFAFCLNPSLAVQEITENGKNLPFTRDHQMILIDFERPVKKNDTAALKIAYAGKIDEYFCYLDIPSKLLQEKYWVESFNVDKKYCFQTGSYVLFTPETYWYPRPGVAYSSENSDWQQAYFSNYRLTVKTINGLQALSQGTRKVPQEKIPAIRSNEYDSNDLIGMRPTGGMRGGGFFRGGGQRGGMGGGNNYGGGGQRGGNQAQGGGNTRGQQRQGGNARGQADDFRNQQVQGGNVRTQQGQRVPPAESGTQRPEGGEFRDRMRSGGDSLVRFRGRRDSVEDIANASVEIKKDSLFIFETDFPTPAITLIIGDYEQKCVEVDHKIFSLWYLKGNDYFTAAFDSITDTIPHQIRLRRSEFENTYSLNYSFKRFSLIEVPVQFRSYVRTWTQAQEVIQPEMVLFPEKGCVLNILDVNRQIESQKRWSKRDGRELSDKDAALRVVNNFFMTFQRAEDRGDFSTERGSVNVTSKSNPYFLFPQLYNFRYNIFSSEWTIGNRLIELYLQDKADNPWMRQMNGISNNEKANLLIQQRSFKDLLIDPEQRDLLDHIISLKANVLFAPAELNAGYMEFRDSLRAYLNLHRFSNIRFEDLLDEMSVIAREDLKSPMAAWDSPTKLPVYIVGNPEITYIINRDAEVYVVRLQITNDSDYDGMIHVETIFGGGGFNFGGGRGNFGGGNSNSVVNDPRAKRKISLAAHETKLLVSVWDEAPRAINVNTLISANLPNIINLPANNILRERNLPIDKEGDFTIADVSYQIPGEVIVDNEDTNLFELSKPDIVGLLPKWLDQVGDDSFPYQGVTGWRPPLQWTLTTNDKYFGTHVRSAYVIKSGSGSQTATWKIPVPAKGLYDLFFHVFIPDEIRRGQDNRGGGRGFSSAGNVEYHLKVKYDNGEDKAYINLRKATEGWNLAGTYYFSDDTVRVVLSNDVANVRMVTADAVKIVRRETGNDRELKIEN